MVPWAYLGQQYYIYAGMFLFIFGITGNIFCIFLLLIQRSYRTTPYTFFILMTCICSNIPLITGLWYRILVTGFNINIDGYSVVFCKLRQYLFYSSIAIPTISVALGTIDHYLITSRNVRFRQLSTIKNAHRALICTVTFWVISCIPYIIFSNITPVVNVCAIPNSTFSRFAVFYLLIVRYAIPVLIMIIFGFLAYRNLKQSVALIQQGYDRQWMNMICMQVILVIISMIPYMAYNIYLQVTTPMSKDSVLLAEESFASALINVNVYIQNSGHFYVFLISSSRYREQAKTHILWWRSANRVRPEEA